MKTKKLLVVLIALMSLFMNSHVIEAKNIYVDNDNFNMEYSNLIVEGDYDKPIDPIEPELPYSYIVNTKTTGLNVRSGPGLNYSIIGSFAKGSTVDCSFISSSSDGKWWKATGKDENTGKRITGYVDSTYLKSKGIN